MFSVTRRSVFTTRGYQLTGTWVTTGAAASNSRGGRSAARWAPAYREHHHGQCSDEAKPCTTGLAGIRDLREQGVQLGHVGEIEFGLVALVGVSALTKFPGAGLK